MQYEWVLLHKAEGSLASQSCEEVFSILIKNRNFAYDLIYEPSLKKLANYLCLRNLEEGAKLTADHLAKNSKITLVGDYDCDGITSLAQITLFLKDIGYQNYSVVIPDRKEGYGFPERALKENPFTDLFIVVDCGTYDKVPIENARRLKADVLVIDHHKIEDISRIAPATVLINPKHPDCSSWFKDFCSAGLTLMFLAKLRQFLPFWIKRPKLDGRYHSLAALGTVADVMPLVEANRIITKSGLNGINENPFEPFSVLKEISGLAGKRLSAGHLGFYIAPRVNAPGRIANPMIAYNFLVSRDKNILLRLGSELNRLNSQRQIEETRVLKKVVQFLKEQSAVFGNRRTLVVADKGWHQGVVGIVASKIIQEYHYGPVIIGSIGDDGIIKASARSIPGIDICKVLSQCEDYLIKWGGHNAAAGLTIACENFENFKIRFEEIVSNMPSELFTRKLHIDCELNKKLISRELLDLIELMEPYGQGNPVPTFLSYNMKVTDVRFFGNNNKHLKIIFDGKFQALLWKGACHFSYLKPGYRCNVVYHLDWDGLNSQCVMVVKDMECYRC